MLIGPTAGRGFHFCDSDDRMRERSPGAHFRRDPDRLHELLVSGSLKQRGTGVSSDAVRALRDMRDSNRDDVLDVGRKCTFGEHSLTEIMECRRGTRSEIAPGSREMTRDRGITRISHGALLLRSSICREGRSSARWHGCGPRPSPHREA